MEERVELFKKDKQIEKNGEMYIASKEFLPIAQELTIEEKENIKNEKIELANEITQLSANTVEEALLYWIDKDRIGTNIEHDYMIDINNEQIYDYNGHKIYQTIYHTLAYINQETEKISIKEPVITSNYSYATITKEGIILYGTINIIYDENPDLENYYSIDGGKNWKKYTGEFTETISNTIIAKSVKKGTKIEAKKEEKIEMKEDALTALAYDKNIETGEHINEGEKIINVDSTVWNQTLKVKGLTYTGRDVNSNAIRFCNQNGDILLKETFQVAGGGTINIDKEYVIPNNTSYISFWSGSATSYYIDVYEIGIKMDPVIKVESYYPLLTIENVQRGHEIITIDYYFEEKEKLYSFDGVNWNKYEHKDIILTIDQNKIYAKGIQEDGTESKVSVYTSGLSDKMYDKDISTYDRIETGEKKIAVDKEAWGKSVRIKGLAYTGRDANSNEIRFYDKDENTITKEIFQITGGGTINIDKEYIIPENTAYISFWSGSSTKYYIDIYEINIRIEPFLIGINYTNPEITKQGIITGYNLFEIEYLNILKEILYSFDGVNWNKYQDNTITVIDGNVLRVKGIMENGKETQIVSSTLVPDYKYDGDLSTYNRIKAGEEIMTINRDMWGQKVKVNGFTSTGRFENSNEIRFYDQNGKILLKDVFQITGGGKINIDKEYLVPENTAYMSFWSGSSTAYYIDIYEVSIVQ